MKLLILLMTLIFSSSSLFAQNFMPVSVIESRGVAGFSIKEECERSSGEQCLNVGERPEIVKLGLVNLVDVIGDDQDKPKYGPESDVEPCDGKEKCREAINLKKCKEGFQSFIDAGYTKIYCTEFLGYEQKVIAKKLAPDEVAIAAYKDQLAAKAIEAKTNEEKKRLAIERIRTFSSSGLDNATTVAGVRAAVKAALLDIVEILK